MPIPLTHFPGEAWALPASLAWPAQEKSHFLLRLESWAKLAPALNEIMASLGHQTFYPFVFSVEIVRKLSFVHYMMRLNCADVAEAEIHAQAA